MLSYRQHFPTFVTGASGFIGGKLVQRLLAEGRPVRVLSRRPLPDLAARGVEVIEGDLDNAAALDRGCREAETVFHVAGKVGVWGRPEDFFHVNVQGTRNLLSACRQANVPRFVYTSSPSVVYNGRDLQNVDESAPLCTKAPCAYPTSKAAAEQEVLKAHSPGRLATVALRPHLVWGPGDRHMVPRILQLARAGKLKIVGQGLNLVDITYITNVVEAHLRAEAALVRPDSPAGGKAYFITNGEPLRLWDWVNYLLHRLGIPEVRKHVSAPLTYAAGGMLEAFWKVTRRKGEPPMTRFVAKELSTEHYFNIYAARRDLAYHPVINLEAATNELVSYYAQGHPY